MFEINKELIKRLLLRHRIYCVDDVMLYSAYLRQDKTDNLSDEQRKLFCDILDHHFEYNLPNYKTIIRERAAIQAQNQDLKDERTKENRARLEEEFRNEYGNIS